MSPSLFFFLLGMAVVANGLRQLLRGRQSESWPTVEGRILDSKVKPPGIGDEGWYTLAVRYRYKVDVRHYEGTVISLGGSASRDEDVVNAALQRYPAGRTLDVHVNPRDPKDAVLEPGPTRHYLLYILFGVVILAMALMLKGRDWASLAD